MRRSRPDTRLYVADDLVQGGRVALHPDQIHYLRAVLRRQAGAELGIFNGRHGEWLGLLEGNGKRAAEVTILEQLRPQSAEPDLWLVFAPVKRARIDYLVEKATELGVAALYPVRTQRTIVERINMARLLANAIEAAEQTERLTVPTIHPFCGLAERLATWPADRPLVLCDERGIAPPIATALQDLSHNLHHVPEGKLAILIGPEGGFSETELDALYKLAFVKPVGLGPRILRADTAALAALAVAQAVIGDWRGERSR